MSLKNEAPHQERSLTSLERARLLSESLADAARRARFSARSKRHGQGGFAGRRGQSLFYWVSLLSFVLLVVIPSALGGAYLALMASDIYVAEYKFTVAGSEPPTVDGIGALTGIPAMSVFQDTQIVVNHLESRAIVEELDRRIELKKLYTSDKIDYFSRFDAGQPIEKLVRYWQGKIDTAIRMPAGIVEVKVRAFFPQDALAIAKASLEISEQLINDLNERMSRDSVANAETEVDRASARLGRARIALESVRNAEGVLDVAVAADAVAKLITEARGAAMRLQQEYNTQLRVVSETAPQMQSLKARINATLKQISELEASLVTRGKQGAGDRSLATLSTKFSELELERQIAERLYAGAITSLELARMTAESKRLYLNTFVQPALPQEARFPRRIMWSVLTFLGTLALWASIMGMVVLVRNHMA